MNTQQIMQLAIEMAGFKSIPLDSKIYVAGNNIQKILIGIDISGAELMLAKELGYDLVIAHHPVSIGGKYKIYKEHIQQMIDAGVPESEAQEAVDARMETFALMDHSGNHDHVSSIAELLNLPFMNIHQPCDEMGRKIMQETIDNKLRENSKATLQEVVNALGELPEFKTAQTEILIAMGKPDDRAGKVKVSHGAYTNGGYEVASAYFRHGIDTIVYIHILPEALRLLLKENLGNIIISGHIVSDEIGINPLIDELRSKGLQVDPISGLRTRR